MLTRKSEYDIIFSEKRESSVLFVFIECNK